jgi:hypothetical protein
MNSKKWEIKLLETSLNLRLKRGHKRNDYYLKREIAERQAKYFPDIMCNVEFMECNTSEYDAYWVKDFNTVIAVDEVYHRGISCLVKKDLKVERIHFMSDPHLLHVKIFREEQYIDLVILRILVAGSDDDDYKDRNIQWKRAMQYVDGIRDKSHLIITGDWNHGVISDSYTGQQARRFFNYQQIVKELEERDIPIVPIDGYSYCGYMKIDHIAVGKLIQVIDAKYEDAFEDKHEIGVPDHKFIVSSLKLCC